MSDCEENENDQESTSMFASVWVKVEVEECPDGPDEPINLGPKRKPTRHTETLKCDLCDYKTVYKSSLKLHMLRHDDSKPLACKSCSYTTKYPVSLHRHTLIQHELKGKKLDENTKLHKCKDCDYSTPFYWNLNAHRRVHKPERHFKCKICSFETTYKHNYMKHMKNHDKKDVLYKCDKCPFETKFEGHIARHLAKIHNEVSENAHKCDFCNFFTTVKWRLNAHKVKNKLENLWKCPDCEFTTLYRCGTKKHKKEHFEIIKATIESQSIDPNIFQSTAGLTEQIANETNDMLESSDFVKDYICHSQGPQTTHEKNNHYIVDHNSEIDLKKVHVAESGTDKPFSCIQCQYTSRFKASVLRHFQRHHTGNQNRPYKCCNCDFSTKTKDQIALHNKRSQSLINLSCPECSFVTKFKCAFAMHQKVHYTHKCSVCNYVCKQKYDIQKHFMTVHLGEGVKCRFCDFKANRKESLLVHEAVHTGKKPYNCDHCDYNSVRRSLLVKHVNRYHSALITEKSPIVFSHGKIESLKVISEKSNPQTSEQEFNLNDGYLDNDDDIIADIMGKKQVN